MSTNTTITLSLPPAMANQVETLSAQQGRSCSELVQEALDRCIKDVEWERITREGERKAREAGIGPKDVTDLIEEYRREITPEEMKT